MANGIVISKNLERCTEGCILDLPLHEILKDVSLLALGCNQNLEIAREVGYVVGMIARSYGYRYVVFGTMDVLDPLDPDPLGKISRSPYISSQVIINLADGLVNSGVLPILRASGKISQDLVKTLISRKAIYPVFVEEPSLAYELERLGYKATFVFPDGSIKGRLPVIETLLEVDLSEVENVRRKALSGAVVLLGRSSEKIHINKPFEKSGVLIFSDEDWLLELAKQVLQGVRSPTGRLP
ncbi:hypothetical protein Theth_0374 [Pseudothermotoga thermarum DSM 5069]|uniref:Uncharacterized protein n=2 Tax=Pseudothermotoga thermarum TaxID=119394 RepID=F7YWV0_9THEM|nr:hypothetical protein Theth_0374 [Pseudothermotoga thermarum DSM 5069]